MIKHVTLFQLRNDKSLREPSSVPGPKASFVSRYGKEPFTIRYWSSNAPDLTYSTSSVAAPVAYWDSSTDSASSYYTYSTQTSTTGGSYYGDY